MRISTGSPVAAISGRLRNSPMVFYSRGGACFARAHVRQRDPKTSAQKQRRAHMGVVSRAWTRLTRQQRDGWEAYGQRWFPGQRAHGLNTYVKVSAFLPELPGDPPVQPPPPAILAAQEEPSAANDEFAFRLTHPIADITGWKVLVCVTPATVALTRAPREVDLRWICGYGMQSLAELPASGDMFRISGALVPVAAGSRYGVQLRLVSPEGVPGPEIKLDLVRQAGPVPLRAKTAERTCQPGVSLFFDPCASGVRIRKDQTITGPIHALRVSKRRRWPGARGG